MATALESALIRDRVFVLGALVIVVALSWAWIVPMARDMYGPMTGPSAWMMTAEWDARHLALLFAMWTVMMAGMMLPSAAPALLIFTGVVRRSLDGTNAALRASLFALGYLVAWTGFAALATALQRWLAQTFVLSPMMEVTSPVTSGVILILAGAYQFTPLKQACLSTCRSPLNLIMRDWRPGPTGALRMGMTHGWFCLGCCWALMLLLFAAGVMNLTVIALITIFVLLEKAVPLGRLGGKITGAALMGAGLNLVIW